MELNTTTIDGIQYEMFNAQPICFGECFLWGTEFDPIIDVMRELEYISDTYTNDCVKMAEKTKCYKTWQNYNEAFILSHRSHSLIKEPSPDVCLGPIGNRVCSYKAIIIAFIYMYLKQNNIDWKSWELFLSPISVSSYANNLYYLLRFNSSYINPHLGTLPTLPTGSCIGYVLDRNGFQHAFLMILEGDYFVIYDAWSGVRSKWIRALEKNQAIEILGKIKDSKDFELRKKLFGYFFSPKKNTGSNDINFSSQWNIVYLPFESDLFKDAFEKSKGEMLFRGGKKTRVRKPLTKFKTINHKKLKIKYTNNVTKCLNRRMN